MNQTFSNLYFVCVRTLAVSALVAGLCVSTWSIADAQDDRGRGRGGARGGGAPGGGGMMFGGGGGRGGDPAMGLLRSDQVREELGLDEKQLEALKKLEAKMREQGRPDFDWGGASEEERRKFFEKMQEDRKKQSEEARMQLEEVLTFEQMERLDQLSIQVQGVMALATPTVQDELEMTEAQKAKLDEIRSGMESKIRDKMREIMESRDRDAMRTAMQTMREDMEKEVMSVLTDAQKKEFEEMKGEPFEMESLRGGGGRGGAGGGRGGAGGGRGGAGGGGRPGGGGRGGDRPE